MMIELANRTRFDFVNDSLITIGDTDDYSLGMSLRNVDGHWDLLEMFDCYYERRPPWIRRMAIANIYEARAKVLAHNDEHPLRVYASYAKALYHTPESRLIKAFRIFR